MLSCNVIDGLDKAHAAPPSPSATLAAFDVFAAITGSRLRTALVARYGVEVGVEACADALAYAWEHWPRVGVMQNPAGYLYRVAQTSVRRQHLWRRGEMFPREAPTAEADVDPALHQALALLDERQRVAVVMAHVYGWSYAEIADLMDVPVGTVRNLIHRGLAKLRRLLERAT
jgi:DNA-directed RNA polymerase specialized sigma24 family protein